MRPEKSASKLEKNLAGYIEKTMPKVKTVSVVGVPDRRLGEVPMAFIQLEEGKAGSEDEIIDFCEDKLANFKVPGYVKFVPNFR